MILVQFMEEVKFVQSWIFWGFIRTVDSKLEQMAANGTLRDTVRQDNRISLFVGVLQYHQVQRGKPYVGMFLIFS